MTFPKIDHCVEKKNVNLISLTVVGDTDVKYFDIIFAFMRGPGAENRNENLIL